MKKFVAILAAVMFVFLAVVPAMASADLGSYTMYVSSSNGKGVRMRTAPSTSSTILFNLGEGRPVTVHGVVDGWAVVTEQVNGKSYDGYIMNSYLSSTDPSTQRQTFKAVKPFTIKVRTATSTGVVSMWDTTSKTTGHKIRNLTKTEVLTVTRESRAWYIVEDMYGMVGYVAKAYVTTC